MCALYQRSLCLFWLGWCSRGEAASCHITSSQPPNTFLPTVDSAFVPQPAVVFPQTYIIVFPQSTSLYFLKARCCISSKPVVTFVSAAASSQWFLCDSLRDSGSAFLPSCSELIYEEADASYSFCIHIWLSSVQNIYERKEQNQKRYFYCQSCFDSMTLRFVEAKLIFVKKKIKRRCK